MPNLKKKDPANKKFHSYDEFSYSYSEKCISAILSLHWKNRKHWICLKWSAFLTFQLNEKTKEIEIYSQA